MNGFLNDLRYAARSLRRAPGLEREGYDDHKAAVHQRMIAHAAFDLIVGLRLADWLLRR